jgi:hypothetical protein
MREPTLLRDRPLHMQIILGGVIPGIVGVIAGILIGISATAYWLFQIVVVVGGFLAGFEHQDGWGGADRGLVAGFIYGVALLITHAITGKHALVSLGSFPPFFAIVTAIIGMFITAAGGRLARLQRERRGASAPAG